jgi:hypothetical protein
MGTHSGQEKDGEWGRRIAHLDTAHFGIAGRLGAEEDVERGVRCRGILVESRPATESKRGEKIVVSSTSQQQFSCNISIKGPTRL